MLLLLSLCILIHKNIDTEVYIKRYIKNYKLKKTYETNTTSIPFHKNTELHSVGFCFLVLFFNNKHYLFATSWFTETLQHLYHHSWRGTVLDTRMRVDPISAFLYNPMKIHIEVYSKLSLNWYDRISMVDSDILG